MAREKVICRGTRGDRGEAGAPRDESVPQGISGVAGVVSVSGFYGLPHDLLPPIPWLASYIHSAELNALNGKMEQCAKKLDWIGKICRSAVEAYPEAATRYRFVTDSTHALAANVLAGRDVFGRDRSYVPLLSFTSLQNHLLSEIQNAAALENAVASLRTADKDQLRVRRNVQAALDAVKASSTLIEGRIRLQFDKLATLQAEIGQLRTELDHLWHELEDASEVFQRAVQKKSGGCGVRQALSFAAMAVAVYSTGGAAIALAESSYTAFVKIKSLRTAHSADSLSQRFKADAEELTSILEPAGRDLDSFKASLQRAEDAVSKYRATRPTVPNTPSQTISDYAKIVANKADFDREIERFRSMREAESYKHLMDSFIAVSQARNNRILEHDNTVRDIWASWAHLQSISAEVGGVVSATEYDYDLADALALGERMLDKAKWNALVTVSDMARSLEYLTGVRPGINYEDRSVGIIAGVANVVADNYIQGLSSRPQLATQSKGLSIPLAKVLSPRALKRFVTGEQVSLVISPSPEDDIFPNRYCVTTRRLYLLSAPVGAFRLVFEHQGRSLTRLRDGSLASYTHATIQGIYEVDPREQVTSDGDAGTSSDFVGVSPYGPWRVQLFASPQVARKLESAAIAFDIQSYTYFPA